jgi:hypothetical protein
LALHVTTPVDRGEQDGKQADVLLVSRNNTQSAVAVATEGRLEMPQVPDKPRSEMTKEELVLAIRVEQMEKLAREQAEAKEGD